MKRLCEIMIALMLCVALTLAFASCDISDGDGTTENEQGGSVGDNNENPEENGGGDTNAPESEGGNIENPDGGNGGDAPDDNEGDDPDDNNSDITEGDDADETVKAPSEGLAYKLSNDGTYYSVVGLGECVDTHIVIPAVYESLPVKEIAERAFENCKTLVSVEILGGVERISYSAFSGCSYLADVKLGDSLEIINEGVFNFCSSLSEITIPKSVKTLAQSIFSHCGKLTVIEVDEANTIYKSVDGNLYSKDGKVLHQYAIGKKDDSFTVPDGVETIDREAFFCCTNLTSVKVSDSVKIIKDSAFSSCRNLADLNLGSSVESMGMDAFKSCYALTEIELPSSVKQIGTGAFFSCDNLSYNKYDNGYYLGNDENPYFALIKPTSQTISSCTINNGTVVIANLALNYCEHLREIVIPDSVKYIGEEAFSYCYKLASVKIGEGVESIGEKAFSYCTRLSSVVMGDGVKSIAKRTFADCTALTDIVIGKGVEEIAVWAFSRSNNIESVYYNGTAEEWDKIGVDFEFENSELKNATIYYYSETSVTDGVHWHYTESGEIEVWS